MTGVLVGREDLDTDRHMPRKDELEMGFLLLQAKEPKIASNLGARRDAWNRFFLITLGRTITAYTWISDFEPPEP